ncbi:hypothetical protein BDV98DRAFT_557248 [Pterulicium gracile]|uniref:WW domain-containing protein n=1 Tax=Pterulicium gracile TaxID=1884261 RepID=A0A5C3R2G7_9AGAR|nr:hypothetical protein BDV98DRAFT_557248 [Pterula gracilis]
MFTTTKPAYKQLPLPADWTIFREAGMKLYHHTPSGVVTDKDPRRPAAHKVLTKFVRRGSVELVEMVFARG